MNMLDKHTKQEIFNNLHKKLDIDFLIIFNQSLDKTSIMILNNIGDAKIILNVFENETDELQDLEQHIRNITNENK